MWPNEANRNHVNCTCSQPRGKCNNSLGFVLFCFVLFFFSFTQVHFAHTHTLSTLTQFGAFFGSVQKFSHTVPGTYDLWNGLIYVNNVATLVAVVVVNF